VAEFLLEVGLPGFSGVVYLDSMDRPMVRMRGSTSERQRRPAVHLHECGLRPEQRFTFYDNVHTTGLDVPQAPNAVAVITVGKDTSLRDYSQGAYRMRGVGQGQCLNVFLIPEVVKLIQDSGVGAKSSARSMQSDLVSWCFLNELKSQSLQFIKLCGQNVANVWRKRSFDKLLADVHSGTVRSVHESETKKGQNSS
jgi:hypothetical protein